MDKPTSQEEPTNDAPAPAPSQQPEATPAQPAAQQVQYVMAKKSLEGLGGWLIGWLLYLAAWGIGGISAFFGVLESSSTTTSYTYTTTNTSSADVRGLSLVFLPLIAATSITAIVLIAQHKSLAIKASFAMIGLVGLYTVLATLISSGSASSAAATAGGICTTLVVCGLQALYFVQSERVKATLTK